jgi:tRNA(Ile)-lysidine synthetase-like protein
MLPLVARCRQDGDEIEFDYGTKKVKKCFIDQKVGKSFRDLPILLEKDDIILAILGVARSKNLSSLKDCDITIELKETKNESKSLH